MANSPEKLSVNHLESVIEHVRDIVMMFRRRGVKTEYAIPEVANILDLTPKRAKSLFYRDGIWGISMDEVAKIERRFSEHLDAEIALSMEYTEQLRAKRDQINMGLVCTNQSYSRRGGGCVSTGLPLRSAG